MKIDLEIRPADLTRKIERLWELSGAKIRSIQRDYDAARRLPEFQMCNRTS